MHSNKLRLFLYYFVALQILQAGARGPCDPLVPEYCYLPFPNSFYTVPSDKTPSGRVINVSSHSLPLDALGRKLHPHEWNTFDGFSLFPSIITYIPNLSDAYLPPHWDVERSLLKDSPTILFNLNTSEIVPHFAELDTSQKYITTDTRKALMIWPSQSLSANTHYLVVLRNLLDTSGNPIQPSTGFISLRDNIISKDSDIEYRRKEFNNYFNVLTNQLGVERQNIQLMWDFTTASIHSLTGRLLHMRNDALERVGPNGPSYSVDEINNHYTKDIFRRIRGVYKVPLYLNTQLPGSHLIIDDDGLPVYQGEAIASFTVLIPHSVANGSITNVAMIQYGHGLFGSENEVETDYLQRQANQYGYILFACNLWGIADIDLPSIIYTIETNISNIRIIPDRISQGVVNQLVLMRLMKGSFVNDPSVMFNGVSLIDPSMSFFYGISVGGIEGVVYMALTTDVKRGVLGVPGGPFGLLLPRSTDFSQFETMLRLLYNDPVDYITLVSFLNMIWSRAGPNAYMSYISSRETLPGTPPHQVLYQYALGDAQVNVLGLYSVARSSRAKMFASNVKQKYAHPPTNIIITERLYGFQYVPDDGVIEGADGAVGFDCGAPPELMGNVPPNEGTDTHEKPRRAKLAQEQIDHFIRTGTIWNYCNGPCTNCSPP